MPILGKKKRQVADDVVQEESAPVRTERNPMIATVVCAVVAVGLAGCAYVVCTDNMHAAIAARQAEGTSAIASVAGETMLGYSRQVMAVNEAIEAQKAAYDNTYEHAYQLMSVDAAREQVLLQALERAGFVEDENNPGEFILQADESVVVSSDNMEQGETSSSWVYLVQPGDNLSALSAAFGYSVDEIANLNDIRDVNLIYAESSLRIPVTG